MISYSSSNGFLLAGVVLHLLVGSLLFKHFRASQRRPYPLPPGPPGEPLLGHFRLVPAVGPEQKYIEWGKKYNSDILYLNVLGRPIIVINSARVAHDLLDKRGANYSSRPRFVLFEVYVPCPHIQARSHKV